MKNFTTITAMVVLTLAFGVAYADEMPVFSSNKDIGTLLSGDAFTAHDRIVANKETVGSVAGGDELPVLGSNKDIGTLLYENAFAAHEPVMADKEARGLAAGGAAKEDENTRVWDNLLGVPGGSNLP